MPKGTPVEQALGNLYMVMNRPITHHSPKIQDAQTPEEQLALAITYCFDIQRKLEYACHTLEAFADLATPSWRSSSATTTKSCAMRASAGRNASTSRTGSCWRCTRRSTRSTSTR